MKIAICDDSKGDREALRALLETYGQDFEIREYNSGKSLCGDMDYVREWTLQQYEGKYRSAMYAAVKAANPNWQPGQPFDPSILDSVTRESVESQLVKSGNTLVTIKSKDGKELWIDTSSLSYDTLMNMFKNLPKGGNYFDSSYWQKNIQKAVFAVEQ